MQAVILAGGLGTRLREIVSDRPKALVRVCEKVFLEYQLEFLERYSIREVILCIGYLGAEIEKYFLNRDEGIRIVFSREQEPLGTGGALKNAKDLLNSQFFVLNGDTIFLTNLFDMKEFHQDNSADLTIALATVKDQSQYGSVRLEDVDPSRRGSRVIGFVEKSRSIGQQVSAGIYLVEKKLFSWDDLPKSFSLENYFLPAALQGSKVFGYLDENAYFVDIGTTKGYKKFEADLKSRKIPAFR